MAQPGHDPYTDLAALAGKVGAAPEDPNLVEVAAATDAVIDAYYGTATVADRLPAEPPWPAAVAQAALTISVDLWRRPSTPGGYFQVADYVGRLSLDPAQPVAVLLDSVGRVEWPVA